MGIKDIANWYWWIDATSFGLAGCHLATAFLDKQDMVDLISVNLRRRYV
jgi:hypothetical protein